MSTKARKDQVNGDTMAPMPPAHAKPARRDHLWVLVIIAACAQLEVWESWITVGSMSGFPKIGPVSTAWTLAVVVEAYWGYAFYAWLAAAPGPRSRRFAMWSAIAVFGLSLIGQGASHLVPPGAKPSPALVVFVTSLPVITLALIAVLVHLRQLDREEAAAVATVAAEASERDALRAELDTVRETLAGVAAERKAAQAEAAALTAKIETLTRKLAAAAPRKRTPQKPAKNPAAAPRSKPAETPAEDPAAEMPGDVDVQAEALAILVAEPDISGAKLGARVGRSERWGQDFKKNLAGSSAGPESRPDERS